MPTIPANHRHTDRSLEVASTGLTSPLPGQPHSKPRPLEFQSRCPLGSCDSNKTSGKTLHQITTGTPEATSMLVQAITIPNLTAAWQRVRRNRGGPGVDGETILQFGQYAAKRLAQLQETVLAADYRPLPLRRVRIKPGGKKPRTLAIPAVSDRVLQTAVAQFLTPKFEAEFNDCSYAYRPARSVAQAVARVVSYREQGLRWVVKADIQSFFDEIDHILLLRAFAQLVTDKQLQCLVRMWITPEMIDGNSRWCSVKGVPQGLPISPLLSNLYLTPLDNALQTAQLSVVRYADDLVIACRRRKAADKTLRLATSVLAELKLGFNPAKTFLVNFDQNFRFLGVRFTGSTVVIPPLRQPFHQRTNNLLNGSSFTPKITQPSDSQLSTIKQDDPPPPSQPLTANATTTTLQQNHRVARAEPSLRTLYLLEPGCVLRKQGQRLVIQKQGQTLADIPGIKVDQVFLFGNSTVTTPAMHFCLRSGIPVTLLTAQGRYLGVVERCSTEPVLLQRAQFKRSDDPEFCLKVARALVNGKLCNCKLILRRFARKRSAPHSEKAIKEITRLLAGVSHAPDLNRLRGYEGAAARAYFGAMRSLIEPQWGFRRRQRRPTPDPVNALLSFGYTLLFHNIYAFVRARGLNPKIGLFHRFSTGHPALVSDLMEEFRPLVVDALVWSLVLNAHITPADFSYSQDASRRCLLSATACKLFLHRFESKISSPVTHAASSVRLDYRRCMDQQVLMFCRLLRGNLDEYTPMVLR